jgi:hypothetical protein
MTAQDNFSPERSQPVINGPAENFAAVAPNDNADLSNVTRYLYVGGTGDVAIQPYSGGDPVTFKTVPAGTLLPVRTPRVMSTGTTATNIVAMW